MLLFISADSKEERLEGLLPRFFLFLYLPIMLRSINYYLQTHELLYPALYPQLVWPLGRMHENTWFLGRMSVSFETDRARRAARRQ